MIKTIGFDFDDTLTDSVEYCFELFKHWHKNVAKLGNYTGNYLPQNYNVNDRFTNISELQKKQFATYYFNKMVYDVPMRKGAKETIDALHEYHYDVHIITRRSTERGLMEVSGPVIKIVTQEWLNKNRIIVDKIHYNCINKSHTMKEHGIGLLVEDAPMNIQTVSPYFPVIIVDAPWNRGVDFSNTYRVKDFEPDEILGILTKMEELVE